MNILLLNTLILTDRKEKAMYLKDKITKETAIDLIGQHGYESAIGHAATARVMSEDFGLEIPVNRQEAKQELGQMAICCKLKGRPKEGVILNEDEIRKIGYDYYLLILVA